MSAVNSIKQTLWDSRTTSEKGILIALSLVSIFVLASGCLTAAHIKPFSNGWNAVFQGKNIAILALGGLTFMGLLACVYSREKTEGKFFNLTRAQKVFLVSLIAVTIALLTLNKVGVSPFTKDFYANYMHTAGIPGYFANAGVLLGVFLLMCAYNMPKEPKRNIEEILKEGAIDKPKAATQTHLDLTLTHPIPERPDPQTQELLKAIEEAKPLIEDYEAGPKKESDASDRVETLTAAPEATLPENYQDQEEPTRAFYESEGTAVIVDFHDSAMPVGSVKVKFHGDES